MPPSTGHSKLFAASSTSRSRSGAGSIVFPRIRMLKEPNRRIRFLTREEADRLHEALPEHLRPVVQFALATGCRMSEILHLEWTRVDFGRRGVVGPGDTRGRAGTS